MFKQCSRSARRAPFCTASSPKCSQNLNLFDTMLTRNCHNVTNFIKCCEMFAKWLTYVWQMVGKCLPKAAKKKAITLPPCPQPNYELSQLQNGALEHCLVPAKMFEFISFFNHEKCTNFIHENSRIHHFSFHGCIGPPHTRTERSPQIVNDALPY